jgi:hypothetical protein
VLPNSHFLHEFTKKIHTFSQICFTGMDGNHHHHHQSAANSTGLQLATDGKERSK